MKVSVAMITYRQEAYVAQAIESILAQRTNFDFEIVIGEDGSPDRTGEIVREYAAKYPNKIRALIRKPNIGMMRNWVETFGACTGQYIAALEGDDWWNNPDKLQLQVDAMDAHPEWTACFHRFRFIYNDGREPAVEDKAIPAVLGVKDFVIWNPIQTGCVMFRHGIVTQFPPGFLKLGLGDWPTAILHANKGPIGFLDLVMTSYRVHSGGVWSLTSQRSQTEKIAEMFDCVAPVLKGVDRRAISEQAANRFVALASEYRGLGDRPKARSYAWRATKSGFHSGGFFQRRFQMQMLGLYAPWLVRAGVGIKRFFSKAPAAEGKT